MQLLKQSTAFTTLVGPILDSTGAAYTGAVIGDLNLTKNGATAAMAAAATLTHDHNGYYLLVGTTGNSDTLGRLQVSCNKATYSMRIEEFEVLAAAPFDTLVTNGTLAGTTAGGTLTIAGGKAAVTLAATDVTGNVAADVQTVKTQTVTCAAGVTVGAFVGNATAALAVNASGRVDLGLWLGVAPLALSSQQVQALASALGTGVITTTSIADNAFTAAKIADGAIDAATFAANALDAVWSTATRLLTAGTNIALAKGTGVTGFTDLSAGDVRSAVGLATANLDTQLAALQADTDDIQTRLPAALVSGRMDASVGAMAANVLTATAIAADAITAAKIADAAIDAATFAAGAINAAAIAANAITAAKVATDAIGAAQLAADAVTEIQSGLSTLTAAGVRTAVGLATNNLDTQLAAIAAYIDTEVGTLVAGVADIQSRLPAALTGDGNLKADALKLNGAAPNNVAASDIVTGTLTVTGGKVALLSTGLDDVIGYTDPFGATLTLPQTLQMLTFLRGLTDGNYAPTGAVNFAVTDGPTVATPGPSELASISLDAARNPTSVVYRPYSPAP